MKVIINGAAGYMGRILRDMVEAAPDMELVGLVDPAGGEGVFPGMDQCSAEADVVIDFSLPESTAALVDYCRRQRAGAVIATTGHTKAQKEQIAALGKEVPVFFSANMSLGVALLARLAKEAAAVMGEADVEILEIHHNRKVDAPSGTALMLAEAVQEARPELTCHCGRAGQGKREKKEIGISAVRMGNITGTHEVMFATGNQVITLKHEARDRALFAEGAIAAAGFLHGKPAGVYTMQDLVNEG